MNEPVEYIGGQTEPPHRQAWPFALAAGGIAVAVFGAIFAWPFVRGAARSVGETVLPYSVNVRGTWSSEEKIAGGPVDIVLRVDNSDPRTINGITLRTKGLSARWKILSASPDAKINGDSVFFKDSVSPGKSETLTVHLLPVQAGETSFQLSLSEGQQRAPMRLRTGNNSVGTVLNAGANVRDPTPSDFAVRPQLFYASEIVAGSQSSWQVQIQNAGAVRITSVVLAFTIPDSFEVTAADPSGALSQGGRNVRFETKLDPGDTMTMAIRFVPHNTGNFHLGYRLFLDDDPRPIMLGNGQAQAPFDVRVAGLDQ